MSSLFYPAAPSPLVVDGIQMWEDAPSAAPGSPGLDPLRWVKFLGDALTRRFQTIQIYDQYYRGECALPSGPTSVTTVYRRLLKECRSNWAELVVDAVNERLRVTGFRFSDDPTDDPDGNQSADLQAWQDIWQRNNLDAGSDTLHVESLVWGYAYAIVWPDDQDNAIITPESPTEVICYAPATNRNAVSMALKRWEDDWGVWNATLYTPLAIYKYQSVSSASVPGGLPPTTWSQREVPGEEWPLTNPFGQVPVTEFPNNPRLLTGGRSELDGGCIPMIDRINETVFNRLLAAQFSAFRQKWVTGMEIPRDPITQKPKEPFQAAIDRLWMSENPESKFGEFSEASLTNYVAAAEADIQHLAAITRTPAYYLFPHGEMPSGEALKASEAGLVAKVKRRQRFFGEAWEQTFRLALQIEGDPRANDMGCETLWAAPETKSDAGTGDLLSKLAAIGVPLPILLEMSGYFSPQQLARIADMIDAEPPEPAPTVVLPDLVPPVLPPPALESDPAPVPT